MDGEPHRIGLVGIGKIARDQHIPSIAASPDFVLAATASRNAKVRGVESFRTLEQLLRSRRDIDSIVLCTPPQVRYGDALAAISQGRNVMLEKPPGATLAEVEDLRHRANEKQVCLFATWHSRFADGVPHARQWLAGKNIERIRIDWKEDVRRWHPGQKWIWQTGGLGVFDPGINALSILTAIFPRGIHVRRATLEIPRNKETPIAASLEFFDPGGATIEAEFDWRQDGEQIWQIHATAGDASMVLSHGGRRMAVDGQLVIDGADREYAGIYRRFHELLTSRRSEVELEPMLHVWDAIALARRRVVAEFE